MKANLRVRPTTTALTLAILAVACLAAPMRASASSINFIGGGKSAPVVVEAFDVNTGRYEFMRPYAGEWTWWWDPTPPGFEQVFFSYCLDIYSDLEDPQPVTILSTDDLTSSGVPDAGKKAAWLFNTFAWGVHTHGSNADGAALQVAIWEALYDADGDLTSGRFKLLGAEDPTVVPQAQNYIAALFSAPGGYYTSTATWLDSPIGEGQDQIVPVPEPSTVLLVSTLLGSLLLFNRWHIARLHRMAAEALSSRSFRS